MKRQKVEASLSENGMDQEPHVIEAENVEKLAKDEEAGGTDKTAGSRSKRRKGKGAKRNTGDQNGKRSAKIVGPLLYTPGESLPELDHHEGHLVIVHILAQYLTLENDQVKNEEVWGIGPYLHDSDIVCILQHSGSFALTKEIPSFYAMIVNLRVVAGLDSYAGEEKNGIKSKNWGRNEVSLQIEKVDILDEEDTITKELVEKRSADAALEDSSNGLPNSGGTASTEPSGDLTTASTKRKQIRSKKAAAALLAAQPTAQPPAPASEASSAMDIVQTPEAVVTPLPPPQQPSPPSPVVTPPKRSVTPTPSALPQLLSQSQQQLQNPKKRKEPTQTKANRSQNSTTATSGNINKDTMLVWDLTNEPAFKYSFHQICDRGVHPSDWTSYRLKSATLFLENASDRYEVSKSGTVTQNGVEYDCYRWAKVNQLKSRDELRKSQSLPLPQSEVNILFDKLDWSDFLWGAKSVMIRGHLIKLEKLWWMPHRATPNNEKISY